MNEHNKLMGDYIGTLSGILVWDLPPALRKFLERKLELLDKKDKELQDAIAQTHSEIRNDP